MPTGNGYDYRLRCKLDDVPLEAHIAKSGDYFGWYEGEEVVLEIRHKLHTLNIKLDKKGNVSLKRITNLEAIKPKPTGR